MTSLDFRVTVGPEIRIAEKEGIMSDQKNNQEEQAGHPFFGLWAEDEETGKFAFVIQCDCGKTVYYCDKELFAEPEKIYPGMTIDEFQKMNKRHQKLIGMKRQVQRVALAQHAEQYADCPMVIKLKEDAGVSSVQELPNPFRDTK